MICEECGEKLVHCKEGGLQGMRCPACGQKENLAAVMPELELLIR